MEEGLQHPEGIGEPASWDSVVLGQHVQSRRTHPRAEGVKEGRGPVRDLGQGRTGRVNPDLDRVGGEPDQRQVWGESEEALSGLEKWAV